MSNLPSDSLHSPPPLTAAELRCLQRALRQMRAGEFFEAHEVLEEAWAPCRNGNRLFLQAIIHVAVGAYHANNRNLLGMQRQFRKAVRKLGAFQPHHAGVDTQRLQQVLNSVLAETDGPMALERGGSVVVPASSFAAPDLSASRSSVLP